MKLIFYIGIGITLLALLYSCYDTYHKIHYATNPIYDIEKEVRAIPGFTKSIILNGHEWFYLGEPQPNDPVQERWACMNCAMRTNNIYKVKEYCKFSKEKGNAEELIKDLSVYYKPISK